MHGAGNNANEVRRPDESAVRTVSEPLVPSHARSPARETPRYSASKAPVPDGSSSCRDGMWRVENPATVTLGRTPRQVSARLPRGQTPPPVTCAPQQGTGREQVKRIADKNATLPAVLIGYRAVPPAHADFPALELLGTILGSGESSRLNRSLVREQKLAAGAQALVNPFGPMRGAGIFGALAIANQGVSADSIRAALVREMAQVGRSVTAEELTKAKNSWRAQTIFGRQSALAMSEAVHYAALYLGDVNAVNRDAARFEAVTLDDIRRVATNYLRADNSLSLLIIPEAR